MDPVHVNMKILPPDESSLPTALFSNYAFVDRMDSEITLYFAHIRAPLSIGPRTPEEIQHLKDNGIQPVVSTAVVFPERMLEGLIKALTSMRSRQGED